MKQIEVDKLAEEYAYGRGHEHYNFLFEENAGNPSDFAKLCYKDGYQDGLNADRWYYPSKGELPKDGADVWDGHSMLNYIPDKKRWVYNREFRVDEPICWCYLPKPPKNEELEEEA